MRRINRKQKVLAQNYLPYARVNIWPTAKNTKKQKSIFRRNTGFFSAELGIRLAITKYPKLLYKYKTNSNSFLQFRSVQPISIKQNGLNSKKEYYQSFNNISMQTKNQRKYLFNGVNTTTKQWGFSTGPKDQHLGPGYTIKPMVQNNINSISSSNTSNVSIMHPFLKNAALVPGAHRIRKTKSYFYVQKNSVKTLQVWLGQAGSTKMRRFLEQTINMNTATAESGIFGYRNNLLFLTAIESLPIVLYIKTFQYKNTNIIYPLLQNKYLNINGFFIGQWTSLKPGDIFSVQKSKKPAPAFINQSMPLYKKSLFVQSAKVLHSITGQTSMHKYKRFDKVQASRSVGLLRSSRAKY